MEPAIPPEVARSLGYYVYLYVDPRTGKPFYVGKGKDDRVLAHLGSQGESRKAGVLGELRQAGLEPRLEILSHGLADEETALRVEAAIIDLLGLGNLANLVHGWRSVQFGRKSLEELIPYYAAKPVTIDDLVLLIRINRRYRHGIGEGEPGCPEEQEETQYEPQYEPSSSPSPSPDPDAGSDYPPVPGDPYDGPTCDEVGGGPYSVPPGSPRDSDGDGVACE